MPSNDTIERPQEALRVARRYLRRERLVSALIVTLVVSLFLGTYVTTSLLPAVVVAAVLVVIARAPILQSTGTVQLRTDDDPETVLDALTGPTPPVLALQWGVADEVVTEDGAPSYPTSYLFGLRSVVPTVRTRAETTPNGQHRVELEITVKGTPWATYTATISDAGEQTIIDVEYTSNRRFGLRRVPQQVLAERYRDAAFAAQGFTVGERDVQFEL
ncbi:hypothetical protein NDI56_16950 [Haloarcula sp. S1CR25-12]|uniref:SRPBCC family protein n=1 Tax=Haloarcula saliterrae TaxID=2950534 RepID=A0ABU2FFQ3_9EURY|nr:hypothetical protein [Haloarcula sp. S1CR25-12]MDS0261089.1 hypothetical protein [Haloarcula sp. S1CR25-12]